MRLIIILPLLLAGCATTSSVVRDRAAVTYRTHKSQPVLEKCLTDGLSRLDDVTSVNTGDVTTLVFGKRTQPSMLVELAPPRVSVTTTFAPGTRDLIAACI